MSYNAMTIRDVVEQINRQFYLPAIQRPFVWDPEQIVALFDSLMKGYPISSFLFWEIKPENRSNWEIYRFVENFKYNSTHNEITDPDGRDVVLVLDGQQRLTSLLIGLRGTYTVKQKHKRWDNPSAWVKQRLFIDLLKDAGAEESDDDLGVTYGFRFFETPPANSQVSFWFKVGKVLDFDDEDTFDRYKEELVESLPGQTTKDQERTFRRNLDRLYRMVWKDEVVSYYTERNQSYDRVLDIFIRANDGGTKLSKSDLLLSMITSKWEGVNAREEIYNFVRYLNEDLARRNDFDKDFVMRSCLVVTDLDHRYKINNFTTRNLIVIQENWSRIKHAVEATVRLINRFGIDRDTLTSANALMPIVYYISKTDAKGFDGTSAFEVRNAELIRRWLIGALLNNVFGGNSDQTIGVSRTIVADNVDDALDFPYAALVDGLRKRGRITNFDNESIDALLDIKFSQKTCFLALSLLYDNQNWGASFFHIDHIIPRSLCEPKRLRRMGIAEARIEQITECVDRIGNLQILLGRDNVEKSNQPFDEWIQTRAPSFLKEHHIPERPSLWNVENLPEFVAAREELIRKRMRDLAGEVIAAEPDPGKEPAMV